MLNRRNAVKLGAGASVAALSARIRADARESIPAAISGGKRWHNPEIYNPAAFARDVIGSLGGDFAELVDYEVSQAGADYKQAFDAVLRDLPGVADRDHRHPLTLLDEAAMAWASHAYLAGLEAGAACERLRQTITRGPSLCPTCQGHGQVAGDGRPPWRTGRGQPCPSCAGKGTIDREGVR